MPPPPPPPLEDLEAMFFITGPEIHRRNTVLTPILDGEGFFQRVGGFINLCSDSSDVIYIVGWAFDRTWGFPGSGLVGNVLHQKASLGVDVRLLVWAAPWLSGVDMVDSVPEKIFNFCAETAAKSYAEQVQSNIHQIQALRLMGPPENKLKGRALLDWSGTRSHHAKYTVAKAGNELRAFVGPDYLPGYLDRPTHPGGLQWHEVGVRLQGAAVKSVWEDFMTRWAECTTLPTAKLRTDTGIEDYNSPESLPETPAPPPPAVPQTSYSVQVLRSYGRWKFTKTFNGDRAPWSRHPADGVREIHACMVKALGAATRYIYVEDQALNDTMNNHDTVFPHIAQACNKGVKVIFVTSTKPDVTFDLPWDSGLSRDIEQKILDHIDSSKRQNFVLYRVDKLTVHSKVVLIDDRFMMIGSANFFDTSMTGVDSELSVAAVDPGPLIEDLRIELWKDHLHISPGDPNLPQIEAELRDLDKSLAIWRPKWGTGVSFPHPGPVLTLVGPPHEVP